MNTKNIIYAFICFVFSTAYTSDKIDDLGSSDVSTTNTDNTVVSKPLIGPLPIFYDSTFSTSNHLLAASSGYAHTQIAYNVDSIINIQVYRKSAYPVATIDNVPCVNANVIIYWKNGKVETLTDYYAKYYSTLYTTVKKPIKKFLNRTARSTVLIKQTSNLVFFDWWGSLKYRTKSAYLIKDDNIFTTEYIHGVVGGNYMMPHKFR